MKTAKMIHDLPFIINAAKRQMQPRTVYQKQHYILLPDELAIAIVESKNRFEGQKAHLASA